MFDSVVTDSILISGKSDFFDSVSLFPDDCPSCSTIISASVSPAETTVQLCSIIETASITDSAFLHSGLFFIICSSHSSNSNLKTTLHFLRLFYGFSYSYLCLSCHSKVFQQFHLALKLHRRPCISTAQNALPPRSSTAADQNINRATYTALFHNLLILPAHFRPCIMCRARFILKAPLFLKRLWISTFVKQLICNEKHFCTIAEP